MKKKTSPQVDFLTLSKIELSHWLLFILVFILACVAVWQSWLPFFAERHYRDGFNFDAAKRNKFAIEEYEIAVSMAPWETQYQMELARVYSASSDEEKNKELKIGFLKKAEAMSQRMIELDERNPWYKNRIATIYLQLAEAVPEQSKYYSDLAEKLTRDAAIDDSNNPLFQLNIAYFLHRKGDLAESIKYYNRTLEMDPRIVEARYNLADIYRRQGNIDETLNQYLKAVIYSPDFANLYLAIASTYLQRNQIDKAIPYLDKVIKIDPSNFECLKNLGAIYLQSKQWDNASRVYAQMMTHFPDQVELHPFYIQALVNAGKRDQAIVALKIFLDKHADNQTALRQLNILQNAK